MIPGHRWLIVLHGPAAWCRQAAASILRGARRDAPLWVGGEAPAEVRHAPFAKAHGVLGGECDLLVFDALDGLDPDAFGAASGTLRGGGALLLLTPAADAWDSPFLRRLSRLLRDDPDVTWVDPRAPLPAVPPIPPAEAVADATEPTDDQRRAVEAVARVVHGHRRRPLVMTADRGRGKSAALGMAAARLLGEGIERVVVTAPRLDAAAALFDHAARRLEGGEETRGCLRWEGRRIEFLPPDELVARPTQTRLLVVDEAAAIPAPMLRRLLEGHARVVFSTTVHGYEGSGRGFAVRFRDTLDRLTPGWRELRMEQPVRWGAGDPLERFTFRALCLDAATAPDAAPPARAPERFEIGPVAGHRLAEDEPTLRQLFGLLVNAHYRTTPGDLARLLDDPASAVWVARAPEGVAAVALVVDEGGFDEATARAVFEGRRRPHGHLLAQSLSIHGGLEEAPRLRYARIRRIAVHPALRRRGLARALVEAIAGAASGRGVDALGASFGVDPELLGFWRACGLRPVHLGFTRDHAGGSHSAMVLAPLSERGEGLVDQAHLRFGEAFPLLLGGPLRDLDPALAARLLAHCPPPPPLDNAQRREVEAVAHAHRGLDASLPALRGALLHQLSEGMEGEGEGERVAVARLLQRWSWEECARRFAFSGEKEITAAIRNHFRSVANP